MVELAQSMDALKLANEVRYQRKVLKDELRAGQTTVVAALNDPPPWLETMRLAELLLALKFLGKAKVDKALEACRLPNSQTIGTLSPRSRADLITYLYNRNPVLRDRLGVRRWQSGS